MKILFYISTLSGGGAARVMSNLANYFLHDHYEVMLVTNLKNESVYELDKNIIRCIIDPEKKYKNSIEKNLYRIWKLRKIIKEYKPDVVVSFMTENNLRCILATLCLNTSVFVSVRSDPNHECGYGIKGMLVRKIYELASGVICQTPDALKYFSRKTQRKGKVILNQMETKYYDKLSTISEKNNIISVGRFVEAKNHRMLISAYSKISHLIKDNLIIYGDGKLRKEYELQIKELGLEERVKLPGNISNIIECYDSAKVFVLSSDYEGLPNVLMEAMARGVACISTDCPCGGPRLLLEDGQNGILTEVGNETELSEAILKMIINDEERKKFIDRAVLRSQDFNAERVYHQWKNYIIHRD